MEPQAHTESLDDASALLAAHMITATSPVCAQDAVAFCQKEANVIALLREAPDLVEPRKIIDALSAVRLCMSAHADVLSVDCVNALSTDGELRASTTAASVQSAHLKALRNDGGDEDSSMEINIYYSRHHNEAGSPLRSDNALAARHVQSSESLSSLTGVLAHPATWAIVLPFFAVGVYVSLSKVATFLRRRREERRIESKLYMPVN
ncbi:unnamed protein product [Hyaloperonospora brassicae]|uniref:Uncharacterized protein n=1 Tax=Hyaloperonospora brassicae TaxID=162125 RepID=A0AAV0U480_HYABA|nr:unnamed protein product [Hyaloperonospora brassicae]